MHERKRLKESTFLMGGNFFFFILMETEIIAKDAGSGSEHTEFKVYRTVR